MYQWVSVLWDVVLVYMYGQLVGIVKQVYFVFGNVFEFFEMCYFGCQFVWYIYVGIIMLYFSIVVFYQFIVKDNEVFDLFNFSNGDMVVFVNVVLVK